MAYVGETERISRPQSAVDQLVAWLKQEIQPLLRANLEVVLALGADIHVGLKVSLPDGLPAAGALYPQPLGSHTFLFVAVVAAGTVKLPVLTLKPGHRA